ncbi:hypothetical protein OJAV_G00216420 [Oryzias javanicus]|uniref:PIK-related kinase FAT domain-containing protein n=1 Tax=Oryzias javanicus TaxID=123683 RepID=A0A3S2LN46_ORYJA|nr:hypothetical protein OJAV_G00216420 [Oryzias javanicus]
MWIKGLLTETQQQPTLSDPGAAKSRARFEDRLYEHLEWSAPPRLRAHELLGEEMIRADLEVGSTTPYGGVQSHTDQQSSTWGVGLGQLLLSMKKQDTATFYEKLKLVRTKQVVPLSAARTYQRGYEYIIRLHMLSELEHAFTELQMHQGGSTPSLSQLPPHWSDRLEMTQKSFRAKEPILALRRALLSLGPQVSISVSPPEEFPVSGQVSRYRLLPRQSCDVLEERSSSISCH